MKYEKDSDIVDPTGIIQESKSSIGDFIESGRKMEAANNDNDDEKKL